MRPIKSWSTKNMLDICGKFTLKWSAISNCAFFPSGCVDCLTVEEKYLHALHFAFFTARNVPSIKDSCWISSNCFTFLPLYENVLIIFTFFFNLHSKPHCSGFVCHLCSAHTHPFCQQLSQPQCRAILFFSCPATSPCAFQRGSGTMLALCRLPMHSLVRAWHLRGTHSFECKQSLWVFWVKCGQKIASCSFSELFFGRGWGKNIGIEWDDDLPVHFSAGLLKG